MYFVTETQSFTKKRIKRNLKEKNLVKNYIIFNLFWRINTKLICVRFELYIFISFYTFPFSISDLRIMTLTSIIAIPITQLCSQNLIFLLKENKCLNFMSEKAHVATTIATI
jgi:hypothetical protein